MLAASVARRAGMRSGTSTSIVSGALKKSWWGCKQNTVLPISASGPAVTMPAAE